MNDFYFILFSSLFKPYHVLFSKLTVTSLYLTLSSISRFRLQFAFCLFACPLYFVSYIYKPPFIVPLIK